MEKDFTSFLIECLKIIENPNIEHHIKEKTIKSLLKQSIDLQLNYGNKTKEDLKTIVDMATSEQELFVSVLLYLQSNDIKY